MVHRIRRRGGSTPVPIDILIIGPYPPPIGGVSVHIERLVPLLMARGWIVKVLSRYESRPDIPYVSAGLRRNPMLYFVRVCYERARVVHYHHSTWGSLVAVALALRLRGRRPRIITLHSPSIRSDLQHWRRIITQWSLRQFDHVVAVTDEIALIVMPAVGERCVTVIPAFIPPMKSSAIPAALRAFIVTDRTFVAAAWRIKVAAGKDLYGFDVLARAFVRVAEIVPESRLILLVGEAPRGQSGTQLATVQHTLERAGLQERYLLAFGVDLSSVLDHGVILVRPTRTDGDSISVREALAKGRVVIATDVVARPAGTRLVRAGDASALAAAMVEAVHTRSPLVASRLVHADTEIKPVLSELLNLYDSYLST